MTYFRGSSESPSYTCHFSKSFSVQFSKWQGTICGVPCSEPHRYWTLFLLKQRLFESVLSSEHLFYGNNRMNTVWIAGPAHWSLFTSLGVKLCREMCKSELWAELIAWNSSPRDKTGGREEKGREGALLLWGLTRPGTNDWETLTVILLFGARHCSTCFT